jgi:hypothetical protein
LQEINTCNFSVLQSTNFPLPLPLPEAKAWFGRFQSFGTTTNYDWSQIYADILLWETETEGSVTTYPGTLVEVYQVVGSCDSVLIRTDQISVVHQIPADLDECIPEDGYQLIFMCDAFNDEVSSRCLDKFDFASNSRFLNFILFHYLIPCSELDFQKGRKAPAMNIWSKLSLVVSNCLDSPENLGIFKKFVSTVKKS